MPDCYNGASLFLPQLIVVAILHPARCDLSPEISLVHLGNQNKDFVETKGNIHFEVRQQKVMKEPIKSEQILLQIIFLNQKWLRFVILAHQSDFLGLNLIRCNELKCILGLFYTVRLN